MPSRDGFQIADEGIRDSLDRIGAPISPSIVLLLRLLFVVKHPHDILALPPQKLLQPPHHSAHALPVLPVDRDHGAARRGVCWTRAWRVRGERGRDLGENFDLVDVGDRHDHCFDAAGVRVRC